MEHFQIHDVVLHVVIENVMEENENQMNLKLQIEDFENLIQRFFLPNLGCC
jgi:hypothetical protein